MFSVRPPMELARVEVTHPPAHTVGSVLSAGEYLRSATRRSHVDAERSLGLGIPLTLPVYRHAVAVFCAVFEPIEAALAVWEDANPGAWVVTRRAYWALDDLDQLSGGRAELAAVSSSLEKAPPSAICAAEVFGWLYVLEGSALGATAVARQVRTEIAGAPAQFFARADPSRWPGFLAVLDDALDSSDLQAEATRSAQVVFERFVSASRVGNSRG